MRIKLKAINGIFFYPFILVIASILVPPILTVFFGMTGFQSLPFVRIVFVLISGLFLVLFLLRTKFRPRIVNGFFYKVFLMLQFLNVIYFLVGIISGNDKTYLLTDFIYLLLFFFTFSFGAWSFKRYYSAYSQKNFVVCVVVLCLLPLVVRQYIGGGAPDLLLLWLCAVIISIVKKNKLHLVALIAVIVPHLPGINRAFVLAVLSGGILLFLSSKVASKIKIGVTAVSIVMVFLFVFNSTQLFKGGQLERRINESMDVFNNQNNADLPIPIQQRLYEGELIMEDINNGITPIAILIGLGHGKTYDMSNSKDSSILSSQLLGEASTHNIHFLHYALLARFGLIGSIVFIYIFVRATKRAFYILKRASREDNAVELVANLYIYFLFIFSTSASTYLFTSMLFGYFCGVSSQAFEYSRIIHLQKRRWIMAQRFLPSCYSKKNQ